MEETKIIEENITEEVNVEPETNTEETVQFEKGQGTETFKVKSVANQPTIIGYAFSISEDTTAPVQDSTATAAEVAPAQDSIK